MAASDHPITVRFKDSMSPGSCIAGLALDLNFAAVHTAFCFCIPFLSFGIPLRVCASWGIPSVRLRTNPEWAEKHDGG